jgi:hypothetical protein
MADPMAGVIYYAVVGSSAGRKHGTFRRCPSPAACSVASYDATGPYAGDCSGLWPHRKPEECSTTRSSTTSTQPDHPYRQALPISHSERRCECVRTLSALSDGQRSPNTRMHTQPSRRTLSFTIASQTFASSPDGSVSNSAASSACGTPAATGGAGCRFRASSTVTSSSSPCNHAFGHSAVLARSSGRRTRGRRALPTAAHSSLRAVPRWHAPRVRCENP